MGPYTSDLLQQSKCGKSSPSINICAALLYLFQRKDVNLYRERFDNYANWVELQEGDLPPVPSGIASQ
jgi:hypothetical protein